MVTRFPNQADVDEMRRDAEVMPEGPDKVEALRAVENLQAFVTKRAANPPTYDASED